MGAKVLGYKQPCINYNLTIFYVPILNCYRAFYLVCLQQLCRRVM